MTLPILRSSLSLPAAMFYTAAASNLYESIGSPGGIAAVLALTADFLFPATIALWVLADARNNRRALPYDTGSFVFFVWAVAAPVYLFWTRGIRAFAAIGWFLLVCGAAWLVGILPHFLHAMRR